MHTVLPVKSTAHLMSKVILSPLMELSERIVRSGREILYGVDMLVIPVARKHGQTPRSKKRGPSRLTYSVVEAKAFTERFEAVR